MTITAPATINATSFAVAYMDATALVLDGISLVGERRAEKFKQATARMGDAFMYADTMEELNLVESLSRHVQKERAAGRGV